MFEFTLLIKCGRDAGAPVGMSDWIQDAKRREEKARQDELIQEKARQEKSEVIANVLPAWWTEFKSALAGYAKELKEAFPQNHLRQFSFFDPENEPMTCGLKSDAPPERFLKIRVEKSFPHYSLIVEHLFRQPGSIGGPLSQQQQLLGNFQITPSGVTISYDDSMCPTATLVAEKVIRRFIPM